MLEQSARLGSKPSRAPLSPMVGRIIHFSLFVHAMWFFGNLYGEVGFVPNGISATSAAGSAFNAYFTTTHQDSYHAPLTQLGMIALVRPVRAASSGPTFGPDSAKTAAELT
jgi:hypothetical protein